MKAKENFFYIPTIGRNRVGRGIDVLPTGLIHHIEKTRYFVAWLDNIWELKDFDLPWWLSYPVLVTILCASALAAFILYF